MKNLRKSIFKTQAFNEPFEVKTKNTLNNLNRIYIFIIAYIIIHYYFILHKVNFAHFHVAYENCCGLDTCLMRQRSLV